MSRTKVQSRAVNPATFTLSTTGNVDDLDFGNADVIRMFNASLTTLRGLKAGADGQEVTIYSVGAGEVDCAHQNTSSSASNRLVNQVTSGITPLAPGAGSAKYKYDGTTARWRLVNHRQGAPIAYAATGGGVGVMTFTITTSAIMYELSGSKLFTSWYGLVGTIGGTANTELRLGLPNGYTGLSVATGVAAQLAFFLYNQGGNLPGQFMQVASGNPYIQMFNQGATNWTLGTVNLYGQADWWVN